MCLLVSEFQIENKIRCVRFVSECTKFKLIPPGVVLLAFNSLSDTLTPDHVEMIWHIADVGIRRFRCRHTFIK